MISVEFTVIEEWIRIIKITLENIKWFQFRKNLKIKFNYKYWTSYVSKAIGKRNQSKLTISRSGFVCTQFKYDNKNSIKRY